MTHALVRAEGLVKRFNKFELGPIHFQLQPGTVAALVGGNGSGKSTFFRLLMKLIQPDEGQAELLGGRPGMEEEGIKQRIGFAGGLYGALGHLSVKELTAFVSYWYPDWDPDYYAALRDRYEIDENVKFANCSTGTQKKIEFILALAHRPELLLLDEPSASVDLSAQRRMHEDLTAFMEQDGKGIIMATHSADEIRQLCDVICVMERGRIRSSFNKDEIFEQWSCLWVSGLNEAILRHPNTRKSDSHPPRLITDNRAATEAALSEAGIDILQERKVQLEEALVCLMEPSREVKLG